MIFNLKNSSSFAQAIGDRSGRFECSFDRNFVIFRRKIVSGKTDIFEFVVYFKKTVQIAVPFLLLRHKKGCTNHARSIADTYPPSLWGLCKFSSFGVLFFQKDA